VSTATAAGFLYAGTAGGWSAWPQAVAGRLFHLYEHHPKGRPLRGLRAARPVRHGTAQLVPRPAV